MIHLIVSQQQKDRCYEFATEIIEGENQFNRFRQTSSIQIQRTYIGKLAELLFREYLESRGIDIPIGDMFTIFPGQENVDGYDFLLPNGEVIDIKTASKSFHSRIMVPIDQFASRKDYYVGIKLNFHSNVFNYNNIDSADIYGYVTRETMERQPTQNFGEGFCKSYLLDRLIDIEPLITLYLDES